MSGTVEQSGGGGVPSDGTQAGASEPPNPHQTIKEAEDASHVTMARVLVALESSSLWMELLPAYAAEQKRVGTRWALLAGTTAAFTGLAVWPLIGEQLTGTIFGIPWTVAGAICVSLVAFFSAICALVPRVLRHSEMAERAQEITQIYASVFGLLLDLAVEGRDDFDQQQAHRAMTLFSEAKVRKSKLDRLPTRSELSKKRKAAAKGFDERMEMARDLVEAAREEQTALHASRHRRQHSSDEGRPVPNPDGAEPNRQARMGRALFIWAAAVLLGGIAVRVLTLAVPSYEFQTLGLVLHWMTLLAALVLAVTAVVYSSMGLADAGSTQHDRTAALIGLIGGIGLMLFGPLLVFVLALLGGVRF